MPSQNVTLSSDVTTTGWTNTGSGSIANTLAASSGVGDGTHFAALTGGTQGADGLYVGQATFSVGGIASIGPVSYTAHWEASTSKSTGDFLLEFWNSTGTTKLAHMASQLTTTSTSEITSGPTNLTIDDSTVSDWSNFRVKLFTAVGASDTTGNFFGLYITVNYTAATNPPIAKIINNSMIVSCNSAF
jgi:hypothetical protein